MADLSKLHDLETMLAKRRERPALARDLTDGFVRQPAKARIFLSPLRWLLTIAAQIAIVAIVVLGILAIPPVIGCFDQAQRGFFAGDTFGACTARGFSARMGQFEQKIRGLILGSGQ